MHENDFYDDLSGVLEQSWRLLEQAINDSTSPARTPVLISVSADGLAQGRTVVLRGFNRQQRQLQIYTDVRSAKVAQLQAQPTCTLVVYQPNPMILSKKATDGRPIINAESVPTNDENEIAYSHFSVIVFTINELEWLYLPRRGHRRAQFIWDRADSLKSNWLIP